jgi:hypothetical protein
MNDTAYACKMTSTAYVIPRLRSRYGLYFKAASMRRTDVRSRRLAQRAGGLTESNRVRHAESSTRAKGRETHTKRSSEILRDRLAAAVRSAHLWHVR